MIMGAGPEQHGVTSNEWQSNQFQIAPVCRGSAGFFPTMFGELRSQKPSSHIAVIHDWQGFGRLVESSAPTYIRHIKGSAAAADAAVAYWNEHHPTLLFLHLDDVDHAGHDEGWLSEPYYQAVTLADTYVGKVLHAIEQSPFASSTVLIITADHGGTGKSHGAPSMQDLEIPWMAIGAGVNAKELTSIVNTYDTAATVAQLLGIKPNRCWIGKPVLDALTR
jgi:phosphopentomutase